MGKLKTKTQNPNPPPHPAAAPADPEREAEEDAAFLADWRSRQATEAHGSPAQQPGSGSAAADGDGRPPGTRRDASDKHVKMHQRLPHTAPFADCCLRARYRGRTWRPP